MVLNGGILGQQRHHGRQQVLVAHRRPGLGQPVVVLPDAAGHADVLRQVAVVGQNEIVPGEVRVRPTEGPNGAQKADDAFPNGGRFDGVPVDRRAPEISPGGRDQAIGRGPGCGSLFPAGVAAGGGDIEDCDVLHGCRRGCVGVGRPGNAVAGRADADRGCHGGFFHMGSIEGTAAARSGAALSGVLGFQVCGRGSLYGLLGWLSGDVRGPR